MIRPILLAYVNVSTCTTYVHMYINLYDEYFFNNIRAHTIHINTCNRYEFIIIIN